MESEIAALANSIYRDKVRRARAAPTSSKMGWGAELFSEACDRMRSGILAQFTNLDATQVEDVLRQRLQRLRRLHEHGIYQKAARP
jgi:hypothetical protein